jgi:hypothetical protein
MDESKLPPEPLDSPGQNPGTPDNKPQPRNSVDDRRLARIREHRSESQTDPSALIAGLSGVNADPLELEVYILAALLAALEAGPRTIENVEEKTSAINQLVRVVKQTAQISQLLRQHRKPPANELAADRNRAKRRNRDLLPNTDEEISSPPGGISAARAILLAGRRAFRQRRQEHQNRRHSDLVTHDSAG